MTIRRHNYFYKPIEGTPFSLGLALPEGYGMFELLAEQEIKHTIVDGKYVLSYVHTYVHRYYSDRFIRILVRRPID